MLEDLRKHLENKYKELYFYCNHNNQYIWFGRKNEGSIKKRRSVGYIDFKYAVSSFYEFADPDLLSKLDKYIGTFNDE